ncbi:MAG: hypothetical protein E7662_02830 [Ruminococcaceae bacterium]|nr:hypothetical protein [Oscillospiraceae bacterium]
MKRNLLRVIALGLLASMLLVSCGTPADTPDDTSASADTTTAAETTTAETEIVADLPDVKYDGYNFRIFTEDDYIKFVYADEENGESVNDAVYKSNLAVKERFDIKMSIVEQSSWTKWQEIETVVLAGEDAWDISYTHDCSAGDLSLKGYLMNLHDIPYLDFEKPWWPKFTQEAMTLNGKMYLLSNYSSWYGFYATRTMFFNIEMVESNKLDNPYELVKNDKWTLDKLIEMTSSFYKDVNGDGKKDYGDIYGFAMTVPYSLLENFGHEALTKSADGKSVELTLYNDSMVTLMNKLEAWLIGGNNGTVFSNKHSGRYNEDSSNTWFSNGTVLYTYGAIGHLLQGLMETDTVYGILPMPKVTADQEEYIGACCELPGVIPVTIKNKERTGVICEAMAEAGYKNVIPQYYEYALKGRYATDPDSCLMLDILFENRYLSFSYIYRSNNMQRAIELVLQNGGNFASWYETNKPKALEVVDKINKYFLDGTVTK